MFPNGKEIAYSENNKPQMLVDTKELIGGGVDVIYEATFEYQGVLARVDILEIERGVRGEVKHVLNEVKSSTSAFEDKVKGKLKDACLWDLAIQRYVLADLGFLE
ncbi:hypothetical protein [Helicobacter labacensis]|uniref:hypothetical protein n=1 Tax=Helicobacter labacensis TaxID=2316079 RepID=UPI0013CE1D79|nr:hypothetical protein [Helicobacter labacensis]